MIEETGKTSKQFEFTLISTSGKSDIFVIRILDILCFLSLTTIPLVLVFSLIKIAIFWHRESINNIRSNKIFQSMIILFIYQQLGADPGLWRNSESMGHCCLPAFSIHRFLEYKRNYRKSISKYSHSVYHKHNINLNAYNCFLIVNKVEKFNTYKSLICAITYNALTRKYDFIIISCIQISKELLILIRQLRVQQHLSPKSCTLVHVVY